MHISRPATDVTVLADSIEIPGLGHLPVNTFVLHAEQPMLVDTGLPASRPQFLEALGSVIDPADLRWIYLTHPDRDHTGSLMEVLVDAPSARLVTTFLGLGILSIEYAIPPSRVFLLNPGQRLELGDRRIRPFRPPLFDSPATTALVDESTGTCFSSDCFGAPVSEKALAEADDMAAIPADDLLAGQRLWAMVDSPWVSGIDRTQYAATLDAVRALDAPVVLSSHLPPARNALPQLVDMLAGAPDAEPFVGPDQAALEQLLSQMEPSPA